MTINPLRAYQGITPRVGKNCYIDSSAVLIGDITMGSDVSVWPLVAARGDVNKITIGDRTNVQDGTVLHVTRSSSQNPAGYPLVIGDDVTIGHKCMLHGCTLGNRILLGMGSIVLDGATLEDDVFIGAGTVVPPNKVCRSGYLYVGNPMREVRPLKDTELTFLKKSASNYLITKDEYIEELNNT